MFLTKKEFCDYLNKIKTNQEADEEMRKWCDKYSPDSDIFFGEFTMEFEVVDLLDKIMHPENLPGDDVSYFVYELNFGKDFKMGDVLENGKPLDFSCAESLYDYLESLWNRE